MRVFDKGCRRFLVLKVRRRVGVLRCAGEGGVGVGIVLACRGGGASIGLVVSVISGGWVELGSIVAESVCC